MANRDNRVTDLGKKEEEFHYKKISMEPFPAFSPFHSSTTRA